METVRNTRDVVVRLLQRVSSARRSQEIHWSHTKQRFVKANNKTNAEDGQVLEYLQHHPDQVTWERAIKHVGPGVPPPADMLANVGQSTVVDITSLENLIEKYQSGIQRNDEELLSQTGEVLKQLGETNQLLEQVGPQLASRDQASQKLAVDISGIQDTILEIAGQLKHLDEEFGQNRELLANAVAFNQQLHNLLQEVQQQLHDLQAEFTRMQQSQSEVHNFSSLLISGNYPGFAYTIGEALIAVVAGLIVLYLANRSDGQWLGSPIPDIVWGLIAGVLVFIALFTLTWSEADAEVNVVRNTHTN